MNWIARSKLVPVLVVLGVASMPCAAQERGRIDRSEQVRPAIAAQASEAALRVSFFANGQEYRLRLRLNPRVERWSRGSWHHYAGSLEGQENSWARLSVAGNALRGVIYDGHELLAVEPADDGLATVYRVADVHFPTPLSYAGDTVSIPLQEQGTLTPGSPPPEALTVERKLEISAVGDASFRARYGSDAAARDAILTRINIVDGIFSAQVGTAIEVASIDLSDALSSALDPSTDPPILLDSLGRLRQETPSLNSRGLTHLFTGRNLDGDNVGIAYTASLCRARYSASLAEAHNNATLDGLISAHEIAHVFGAPHDGSGACASVPFGQYIMSPVLNTDATTFSQCSLEQMAPRVAEAPCLLPFSPADLALPSSLGAHDATLGANFDWRFDVSNQGDRAASNARVSVQFTPSVEIVSATTEAGSCVVQSSLATCDLASVEAGGSAELGIVIRSATVGTFTAHAQVVTTGDVNRANDQSDGTLRVQAASSAPPAADTPGRSGSGAVDGTMLGALGALLAMAARRRLNPRAAVR